MTVRVRRIVRPVAKTPDTLTTLGQSESGATKKWDYGLLNNKNLGGVVVGLDPSYTGFGLCALAQGGESMLWVHKGRYTGPRRLVEITTWVTDTLRNIELQTGGIEHILMEGYAPERKNGREMAGELCGHIKVALMKKYGWTTKMGYPTILSPGTVKKFAIGKGSGPGTAKEDMKLAAYKRWGLDCPDNNAVDAYCIARVGSQILWPAEVTQAQQEAIDTVLKSGLHTEWPEDEAEFPEPE